jgi:hypothetical protein
LSLKLDFCARGLELTQQFLGVLVGLDEHADAFLDDVTFGFEDLSDGVLLIDFHNFLEGVAHGDVLLDSLEGVLV